MSLSLTLSRPQNIILFKRNRKALMGELILNVIYFGVLIALASTVTNTINPSEPIPNAAASLYGGDNYLYTYYAATLGCVGEGYEGKNCTDGSWKPGTLGLSDSEDGCSSELSTLKDSHLDICNPGFISAYQTPSCICISSLSLESYDSVAANNITAAVIFSPDNFQDFTLHANGIPSFDPAFTSVQNPRSPSEMSAEQNLAVLLQPIYNGLLSFSSSSPLSSLDFNFYWKQMGYPEWEQTNAGAMTNFPMYMCVVFMSGTSTVVIELMNERTRKNDLGLIMSGTTPMAYFSSWFLMALARQAVTIVLATFCSFVWFVPYTSVALSFVTYTIMALYSVFFGLAFAMKFKQSKQVRMECGCD